MIPDRIHLYSAICAKLCRNSRKACGTHWLAATWYLMQQLYIQRPANEHRNSFHSTFTPPRSLQLLMHVFLRGLQHDRGPLRSNTTPTISQHFLTLPETCLGRYLGGYHYFGGACAGALSPAFWTLLQDHAEFDRLFVVESFASPIRNALSSFIISPGSCQLPVSSLLLFTLFKAPKALKVQWNS